MGRQQAYWRVSTPGFRPPFAPACHSPQSRCWAASVESNPSHKQRPHLAAKLHEAGLGLAGVVVPRDDDVNHLRRLQRQNRSVLFSTGLRSGPQNEWATAAKQHRTQTPQQFLPASKPRQNQTRADQVCSC